MHGHTNRILDWLCARLQATTLGGGTSGALDACCDMRRRPLRATKQWGRASRHVVSTDSVTKPAVATKLRTRKVSRPRCVGSVAIPAQLHLM